MAQGKRVNGMVKGSMGDMFNSIARPLSPEQIKRLRMDKAIFLREVRVKVFAGNKENLSTTVWPYGDKSLQQLRNLYDRLHRPDRTACPVEVVDDDGEVPDTLCAFFCTESHLRFTVADGRIIVRGIYRDHNDTVSGRQMLAWLRRQYGSVKINVIEVAPDAVGFWVRMEGEGLVNSWTMDNFHSASLYCNTISCIHTITAK